MKMRIGRLCLGTALLFSAACSVAFAQHDSLWVRTMNGTGSGIDEVQALASDVQGNVYALIRGQAVDTAMVLVKHSLAGERLWWRRYTYPGGVEPCGIALDRSSNVFVTGTSANETSHPGIVTLEYSPNGDSCWTEFFTAAGLADSPSGIQVDVFGNVYVSGTSTTAAGRMDATLLKYSNSGSYQWSRVFDYGGGSQDTILASVLDSTGCLYQVGSSDGRYLAVKYTFAGDRIWARRGGGGTSYDLLIVCAVDINRDLLCGGLSEFTYDSTGILTVK